MLYNLQVLAHYVSGQDPWPLPPISPPNPLPQTPSQFFFFFQIFLWEILFSFCIQNYFICHLSDSTVPTDAGIEPKPILERYVAYFAKNMTDCSFIVLDPYRHHTWLVDFLLAYPTLLEFCHHRVEPVFLHRQKLVLSHFPANPNKNYYNFAESNDFFNIN